MSSEQKHAQPQPKKGFITYREKLLILRLLKFAEKEKLQNSLLVPISSPMNRVAAATGYSLQTLFRIKKAACIDASENSLCPTKKVKGRKYNFTRWQIQEIRRVVYDHCLDKNKSLSLQTLWEFFTKKFDVKCSKEHMRSSLCKLGFITKRRKDKKLVIFEKSEVLNEVKHYLERIHRNSISSNPKPLLYIDETYITSSLTINKTPQLKSTKNGRENFRHVILNVAQVNTFNLGNLLVYKSDTSSGNPHDDNDKSVITHWINNCFSKRFPEPSLVVLCNVPYKSEETQEVPNFRAHKNELIEWLNTRNISCDESMTRLELYHLMDQNKTIKDMLTPLLRKLGHEVIYFPPYYSELNPLEYVWMTLKDKCGTITTDIYNSPVKIAQLIENSIKHFKSDDWFQEVKNVKRLETEYRNRIIKIEEEIPKWEFFEKQVAL